MSLIDADGAPVSTPDSGLDEAEKKKLRSAPG